MTNLRTATGNGVVFVLMLVALSGFEVGFAVETGEKVDAAVEPVRESFANSGESIANAERDPREGPGAGNTEDDVLRTKHEQGSDQGRAEEAMAHVKQTAGKAFGRGAMD